MIGQKKTLKQFYDMIAENRLPVFTVLVGQQGSGKKTLIREVFPEAIYADSNSVGDIRKIVQEAHRYRGRVFVLADADGMKSAARNALLKVVEDGPNGNHFIMTLEDLDNSLDTIKSRAVVIQMEQYALQEVLAYYDERYSERGLKNERELVAQLCETPGQVNSVVQNGGAELDAYVQLVLENVATVSTANALKIGSKLALKKESDGFDLILFFKCFQMRCIMGAKDANDPKYMFACQRTTKYLIDAKRSALNRTMLFDAWVLDMREVLGEG